MSKKGAKDKHNSPEWKKAALAEKGLKHNDDVSFRVENQDIYVGPLTGTLKLDVDGHPYIECEFGGKRLPISINDGYDAYIGSIQILSDEEFMEKIFDGSLKLKVSEYTLFAVDAELTKEIQEEERSKKQSLIYDK